MRTPIVAFTVVCLALSARAVFAQNRPFPQNGDYVAGVRPASITPADAQAVYAKWKATYLKTDCGAGLARVEFQQAGTTVSEGQGYGMVATAYFGDRVAFDGLWSFAKARLNSKGMMGWHVTCSGFTTADYGDGNATDGDLDIGFALAVAAEQWGAPYDTEGRAFLAKLRKVDFDTCSSGRTLGNNGFGSACTSANTSYWMPGYYRVFADFTGDVSWKKAADDALAVWQLGANQATGLIADEVDQNGKVSTQSIVNYNGCRIPWRAVLDYVWFGTPGAKAVADKIATWADGKGPKNLVDGYDVTGAPKSGWNGSICFNGGYATGAMSSTQARVDSLAGYLKTLTVDNYYESSLRVLYYLLLSGAQWRPFAGTTPISDAGVAADSGAPRDSGVIPTTDGGVTGADAGDAVPPEGEVGCSSSGAGRGSGALGAGGAGIALAVVLGARRRRRGSPLRASSSGPPPRTSGGARRGRASPC